MRFLHQPVFSRIDKRKNTEILNHEREFEKKNNAIKIICLILHLKQNEKGTRLWH